MAARFDGNVGEEGRVLLVTKLCAILLMEADFNFANKTIFG